MKPVSVIDEGYSITTVVDSPHKIVFPEAQYKYNFGNKELIISDKYIGTEVFDPVIARVMNLLKQQINQGEDDGKKIHAILMVGGFSQCRYLQQAIESVYLSKLNIIKPNDMFHSFSSGAVSYGIMENLKTKMLDDKQFSMEVQVALKSSEMTDPQLRRVKGPDGKFYSKNRLKHFLKSGNQSYSQKIKTEYPKEAIIGN